jgi:glycosyltransferase involved in cell wall biosynthesis
MRALALSPVPYEGAGCRFRVAQFAPYLASEGIDLTIVPFYTREFFDLVYQPGRSFRKALWFLRQTAGRLATVLRAGRYDVILIYREALPIGPPIIEAALALTGTPLVYDFDDAVFLPNTSEANRWVAALKYPQKIASIIGRCERVIAGNEYLASYARRYNRAVHVIPTSVDTDVFVPRATAPLPGVRPVVGWIGTPTTAGYLAPLRATLTDLGQKHDFSFRIGGAGRRETMPGVAIDNVPWSLDKEVELFNTCDIGVYPLPDDDWAQGKCGFKAIQFMACGVPVVASPVGVNREIIRDGENGFLAASPAEWREKIERLLVDPALRARLGAAGRETITQRYSLQVNAPRVADVLRQALNRGREAATLTAAAGDHR